MIWWVIGVLALFLVMGGLFISKFIFVLFIVLLAVALLGPIKQGRN